MANRRMFSKDIVDSDKFLDMPPTAQNLYFHLGIHADDDGFVSSPKKVQRTATASNDDLSVLINKEFIIPFNSGVVVITDWLLNNQIRKDRYKSTIYKVERQHLALEESGKYRFLEQAEKTNNQEETKEQPMVNQMETQYRLGKYSIGKDSIKKNSPRKQKKTPSHNKNYDEDSQYYKAAVYLYEKVNENLVTKKPNFQNWANDIRLLVEVDKRELGIVKRVIDWCQKNEFWKTNIRSSNKLRRQFEKLYLQMSQEQQSKTVHSKMEVEGVQWDGDHVEF